MRSKADQQHTGLRPLGPYGEGYCTKCRFVVGLTEDGRIEFHERSSGSPYANYANQARVACDGAGTRPGRVTPHRSRLAAFTTKGPVGRICPRCGLRMTALPGAEGFFHTDTGLIDCR